MDNEATPIQPSSKSSEITTYSVITSYFIFEVVIAFFAVVGNSAIIVAFLSYRKLRTTPNYYIVSLAAIDFAMGFIAIPFVLITLDGTPYDRRGLCFFFVTCIVLMDLCSIFSVMALTVDRYMAICKPFSYHAVMSPRRTLAHISVAWIVPIVISLLVPLGWNIADESTRGCFFAEIVSMKYYTFLYLVCFLPLFFIMCGMYRKIFIAIQSQLESLANIQAIGNRLNQPAIAVLKTDSGERVDAADEHEDEQVVSSSKSKSPNKSIRKKSTQRCGQRQWDVTDEILVLKKMERKDKRKYQPVHESGDVPTSLKKEDGVQKEDHKLNGDATIASSEDVHRMSYFGETTKEEIEDQQNIPSSSDYNDGKPFIRFHRIRQERKTAILFVFIMMFLFVSWSPIYIIDIFLAFEVNVDQNLINFAVLLSHFNSAFNPILYAYKSEFRRIFKRWALSLCCRCFKTRFSSVHPHTVTDYSQNYSLNT